MTRTNPREWLATYADGELPDDRRQVVAEFLSHDAEAGTTVQRWQALRQCACRAVSSEPLPSSLRERVLENLASPPRRDPKRTWRIFTLVTSAAALIVLGVLVWQPFHSGNRIRPVITPAALARIYQRCAVERHHDPFGTGGKSSADASVVLAEHAHVDFDAHVPDLSPLGYRLVGACNCPPAEGLPTIHAYYARSSVESTDPSQASTSPRVVSFFSLGCPIELTDCCAWHPSDGQPVRQYDIATTADNLTVLKWDENSRSFAVCSALPAANLVRLVDAVSVADLPAPTATLALHGQPVTPLSAIALIALVLVSASLARQRCSG